MTVYAWQTYASVDDLIDSLGLTGETERESYIDANEARINASLIAGSRYVDRIIGNVVEEVEQTPPYEPLQITCPPAWTLAATMAAVRFYRGAEATFGVVGFGGTGASVYARSTLPEVDLVLIGHRQVGPFA